MIIGTLTPLNISKLWVIVDYSHLDVDHSHLGNGYAISNLSSRQESYYSHITLQLD